MTIFLWIWILLIPIGTFIYLLGLTIEVEPVKLCGSIILGVFFAISIILFIASFFIRGNL